MPRIDPEKNRSYFKKWWEANKDTQKMRVRRNQKRFKVNGVSQLVALGSMARVLDEISKCELVCANCHRLRTKTRGLEGTV